MSFLFIMTAGVQIFFIAHAIYGNRSFWWAPVILLLPIAGCIAYLIVEVMPGVAKGAKQVRAPQQLPIATAPDQAKVEQLTKFGSVSEKMALAQICTNANEYGSAVRLLESCVTGPHAKDPHLHSQLAHAYLLNGQYELAGRGIEWIRAAHPDYRPQETKLLLARALEGQANSDAALNVYRDLVETYAGFEAKARYALFLKALGRTGQARSMFSLIIGQARRTQALIDSERKWVILAHQETMASS